MVAKAKNSIWDRLVEPSWNDLPAEAAEGILRLRFAQRDIDRMNALAEFARNGTLSPEQQEELDTYIQVGHMVSILHSRARMVLKNHRET